MSVLAEPLTIDELDPDDRALIEASEAFMGFTSNDALTMARVPGLLDASAALVHAIYAPGAVSVALKRRMAYLSSKATGCRYCEAHTAYGADLTAEEVDELWTFEQSSRYSEAEKAALALAVESASMEPPSASTRRRIQQNFDADAISELVAILALFGFLNRWNTLMGTPLEAQPREFGQTRLSSTGWQAAQHAPAENTEN